MKKYGLLGEKLSHSYSPIIHKLVFNMYNIDANYELIECDKSELKNKIDDLKNNKYYGYNVTIPYKIEIMKYLDEIDISAKKVGAVNTIANINGKIVGFNTDYIGFLNEVKYYNVDCKCKDCYILGTGGASRAVKSALETLGANVYNVSRNPDGLNIISYDELKNRNIDVLVNTTPLGMYPNVDASPLDEATTKKAKEVFDIIFNPKQTKLLKYANSDKNGLYMLVSQAIAAEEIWQNIEMKDKVDTILKEIEAMI